MLVKAVGLAAAVLCALVLAGIETSQHPHNQVAFLERVAKQVERVQFVPPETEHAIRRAVQSARRNEPRLQESLQLRQQRAIARIEVALATATVAAN